ncbi:hypothetical protein M409DRAFT_19749 [Zasmidium cellare ATCC 36951]|uniref:Uncharacterized protein n=1 Tax=Zasmidium cellare ATCC 36951 TaxID=1080233 RepID=A0A6A6CSL6_ZASCE|nr:uncharacterized protein M409DRAFT_19749 [Zasmidium cellare ATCC 36951]KAF2170144.1 hypothetical protein M409DRAFT_19749 [Zasmidium cellare ATCC 36951]
MASSSSSFKLCGPPLCNAVEGGVQVPTTTETSTTHGSTTTYSGKSVPGHIIFTIPTLKTTSTTEGTALASTSTPSPTPTDNVPYFTYYVYEEPVFSADILESWTSTAIPKRLRQLRGGKEHSNAHDCEGTIRQQAEQVFRGDQPDWLRNMAGDRKSVFVSFWLPQWMPSVKVDEHSVPATEQQAIFPTDSQSHMLGLDETVVSSTSSLSPSSTPEATAKEKTVPQKVAVGVSVPFAAVLLFILIWLIIRLRSRRQKHQQDEEQSPSPSTKNRKHKRDYNTKPLYPHKPLTGLSETSFTTDPQPSYGAILKQRALDKNEENPIPVRNLPELPGSPTEETELLPAISSDDDDFGTHFSGLEDPFSDPRPADFAEIPSPVPESGIRRAMTPGVSPSSYPLRDRLSHESKRRRHAIETVRRQTSSGSGSWRGSVGEEELRKMRKAFELEGEEVGARKLRGSRSFDDVVAAGGKDKDDGRRRRVGCFRPSGRQMLDRDVEGEIVKAMTVIMDGLEGELGYGRDG